MCTVTVAIGRDRPTNLKGREVKLRLRGLQWKSSGWKVSRRAVSAPERMRWNGFQQRVGQTVIVFEGTLHSTKCWRGKAWTGFGEGVDLVDPLVCFGRHPFIPARITSDVATEESVAHDNVVGSIRPS